MPDTAENGSARPQYTGKPPARAIIPQQDVARDIVRFWTQELEPKDWYAGGDALDAQCKDRFGATLDLLNAGGLEGWRGCPDASFGYILLGDQLSRNIHRGSALAFAADAKVRAVVKQSIARGWDLRVTGAARQFFYLPLEHSEVLEDQDRAVRLIKDRLENNAETLLHARAHREVIRRFGRFPFRNVALGRDSTPQEVAFLDAGGYGALVNALRTPG